MGNNTIFGITFKASGSGQVVRETQATGSALGSLANSADKVNSSSQKQVNETKKLTEEYNRLRASISPTYAAQLRLAEGSDVLNRSLAAGVINAKEHKRSVDDLGRSTSASSGYIRSMAGSLALVLSLSSIATKLDEYTKFTAQLKLATDTQSQFADSYENTIRIARTAQGEISSVGVLYARTNNALKELGATQTQIASITETVALSLKVSGATAAESSSAILQLSQAFGSGVLRGEEFNAVNEAAPGLMRELAKAIGVPVGALKEMASNGQLTADVVANAFKSPTLLASLREQAKEVRTISSGYVGLKNELTIALGEFDRATGISRGLASALSALASNANLIIPVMGGLAAVLLALSAPAILTGLGLVAGAVAAIGLPVLAIIAGLTAVTIAYAKFSADSRTELQKLIDKEYELGRVRQEVGRKTGGTLEAEKNQRAYAEATAEVSRRVKELKALQNDINYSAAINNGKASADLLSQEKVLTEKLNIAISQQNTLRKISAEGKARDADLTIKNSAAYSALALEIGITSEKLKVYTAQESQLIALLTSGKITQAEYAEGIAKINKNRQAYLDSQNKLTAAEKLSAKEQKDAAKDAARDAEAYTKARLKYTADLYSANQKSLEGINQSIAATRAEIDNYGKLPSEITAVTLAKLELAKADALLFKDRIAVDGINAQIEAYKRLQDVQAEAESASKGRDNLEKQQKQYDDDQKARLSAVQKANDEQQRQFTKTVDGMDQVFREGFAGMLNGGTSNFKAWTKSLSTTFKTTVADSIYKLLAQPFVVKIVASLLGVAGAGGGVASAASAAASGGSTGGFSFDSLLASGKSLYQGVTNGFGSLTTGLQTSIENLGAFLSTGTGGLGDVLGGTLGQYSSQIATGLSYAGAALSLIQGDVKGAAIQAIATTIGSFTPLGPVGGAIIGAVASSLLGGMFGGHVSRPKYYANTLVSAAGSANIGTSGNGDAKGTGGGVAINAGLGLGSAIKSYAAAFDGTVKSMILGTAYQQKYNVFQASVGAGITKNGANKDVEFKPEQAAAGAANVFLVAVKKGFVTLPAYLQNIVKRSNIVLDNSVSAVRALETIRQMHTALLDLPPVFQSVSAAIDKTVKTSNVSALQARFSAINTYTSLFYSDQENLQSNYKSLSRILGAINVQFPETREEFRKLVDGIDTSTVEGLARFNSLIDLSPTFDAYYKNLAAQAEVTQQAADASKSLAESLSSANFSNIVDFAEFKRVAAVYGVPFAQQYTGKVASFATGTNYLPTDMMAQVHEGERIVPKADNVELMAALDGSNMAQVVDQIAGLRSDTRAGQEKIILHLSDIKTKVRSWDDNGLPAERVRA